MALGTTLPARPPALRHPRDTTSTPTGRPHRLPAMRGRTTPTHPPTPPRTAWIPQLGTTPASERPRQHNAHREPGRTRRGSPAASMPTRDTMHLDTGIPTRLRAALGRGQASRARAPVPLHPQDTMWTPTVLRLRHHVVWELTTPTLALATRRIASKQVLVTTLTKRVSRARLRAPLDRTTT